MEEEFHAVGETCTGAWWSSTRADAFPSISCSTSISGGSIASQELHRAQPAPGAELGASSSCGQFMVSAFGVAPPAMDWNDGLMRGSVERSSQNFLTSGYPPLLLHGLVDVDTTSQQPLFQESLLPNYAVSGEETQLLWGSSMANTNPWAADATSGELSQQFFSPLHGPTVPSLFIHNGSSKGDTNKAASEPMFKKPRLEPPSSLPTFKVRKEKLGDRITALQQLVSPFGKTDTASVLHEAIEYIKFLHEQVGVLSTPYLKSNHPMHGKAKMISNDNEGWKHDLRSRGLCLVPIQSTYPMASDIPTDFWTPTFGGGYR